MAAYPDGVDAYWRLTAIEAQQRLKSSDHGLTATEARQRLATYGANTLNSKRQDTRLRVFIRQFESPVVLILIFALAGTLFIIDLVYPLLDPRIRYGN